MNTSFSRMMHAVAKGTAACSLLLGAHGAWADADISVQPGGTPMQATANVDLSVVVPQLLIFGVGAVGDAIADVQWTMDNAAGAGVGDDQTYSGAAAPFTAPDPYAASATAAILANGGAGSSVSGNQADLPVFLFSNSGADVTITTSVTGGPTGGGTVDALDHDTIGGATIPISDFAGGDGGSIAHPTLTDGSSAPTTHTGGVVNLSDTWTYTYTPSTVPAAGTYEARVTYVASTP